jgi:hypothetical protein
MGLIMLGAKVVPPPPGAVTTTMEGLKASIHLFKPIHFLFPFLAHAIGTLVGAICAVWIALARRTAISLIVGGFFFVGGLINCIFIPAPLWFIALDLILAYFPMAWLGRKLVPN